MFDVGGKGTRLSILIASACFVAPRGLVRTSAIWDAEGTC